MPRKTKDEEVKKVTKTSSKKANTVEVEKKSTSIKKATKTATSKKTTTAKKKSTTIKETTVKTPEKKTTTKSSTAKKTTAKKATAAKTTKKTTTKKTTQTTRKRTTTKKAKPVITTEYYDLPAVYNRTIVKILAQTPSSLFVYWEISEDDKKKLQEQYGESFFQNTKPYLVITNEKID